MTSGNPIKRFKSLALAAIISVCLFLPFITAFTNPAASETIKNIKIRGTFEICVSPRAMPLSDLQADLAKQPPGIQIEFGQALAKALKVDLKTTWLSYRYHAKYTKCDAFMGVARLKNEPENIYLKKTIPFFKVEILFATTKAFKLAVPDDFKGLKVAISNGSVAHDALIDSGAKFFVSYLTDEEKLDALSKGEIDVALITSLGLGWYQKQHSDFKPMIYSSSIIAKEFEYDYAIGLRRADRMTVRDFNDLITTMIDDGTLPNIFKKYGVDYKVNKWVGEFIR